LAAITFSDLDRRFMRRALELARAAKGSTFPNPAVGAVVVSAGGRVAGEGATGVCGGPHAEARALKKAGAAARGATLYVTLEPCSHTGRTPPCADAVIRAGVSRVVAAVKDPNPLVCGKGLRRLRAHGIAVQTGLLRDEAALVNEDFFWAVVKRRPWVTLKLAMTLDGRTTDSFGGSKWITSAASRRAVQDIRRCHGAVAVGKNTLLKDDPKLTARCAKTYYPARIVFSSDTDIPKNSYFFTHADEARSIVVVKGGKKDGIVKSGANKNGIEFWHTGSVSRAGSIGAFLDMAYSEGLTSVLVEGGQTLASAFLEYGFVNKVHLFYGNKLLGGGDSGVCFSRGLPIDMGLSLDGADCRPLGGDFWVTGYLPV